jgi:hypothetical protein
MVAGGEVHNRTGISELVEQLSNAEAVIADKVYSSEMIR